MGFKDLPAAERLRILRSEGGYAGWLREQARLRAGGAPAATPTPTGWVDVPTRVPAAVEPLWRRLAAALQADDRRAVGQAAEGLKRWARQGPVHDGPATDEDQAPGAP